MKMIKINGGSFKIKGLSVTLSSFKIGMYPVKQKQYEKVTRENPSYFKGKKHPVEQLSWYDTINFCNKLSKKEGLPPYYKVLGEEISILGGKGYRLPTEAEWEYAAKGGNKSKGYKYSGSNNLDDVAWYDENSGYQTHPVGQKLPNELGLYDMHGNVWEWCWDWYDDDYYTNCPDKDPEGPDQGLYRVIRGGSWKNYAYRCHVSFRDLYTPEFRYYYLGFRVAKSI